MTGGTALHSAADANEPGTLRVPVEMCKADVNKLLMKDTNPLYLAAQRRFTELVTTLLDLGADANYVMPRILVDQALAKLARSKISDAVNARVDGMTPLHLAVKAANPNVVFKLLQVGAGVNAKVEST